MSCRRDKSPHCHCHSPAPSWERAHRSTCNQLPAHGVGTGASGQSSQKQSLLGFDTVCGLKMNVKTQPWAFTFLCQFGFCCLTLMLTWGGDRVCSLWGAMLCWHSNIGQVRGWAPCQKRSIISEGVRLRTSCQTREEPSRGRWAKLSAVPWCEVSVSPDRHKDVGVWLLLPFLAF